MYPLILIRQMVKWIQNARVTLVRTLPIIVITKLSLRIKRFGPYLTDGKSNLKTTKLVSNSKVTNWRTRIAIRI